MKTDLYTKIVLTVIAVCLTVSLLKEFEVIPTATASSAPAPIPAITQSSVVDVNITHIAGRFITPSYKSTFSGDYGLPVDIRNNNDK